MAAGRGRGSKEVSLGIELQALPQLGGPHLGRGCFGPQPLLRPTAATAASSLFLGTLGFRAARRYRIPARMATRAPAPPKRIL